MNEYARHMASIQNMTGWTELRSAPKHWPVTVMDFAGNVADAVHNGEAWSIYAPNAPMQHGRPIRPVKWKERAEP